MRIGVNLPGPFYASWRVGGRRKRSRGSSPGLLGAFILLPFWMVYGILWIYWQMFRVVVFLATATYRWLAPIVQRRLAERRGPPVPETQKASARTKRTEAKSDVLDDPTITIVVEHHYNPAMTAQTASDEQTVVKPPNFA